jgi:hypothetical protein
MTYTKNKGRRIVILIDCSESCIEHIDNIQTAVRDVK